eukprot:COSAG01_NODE_4551_length_4930_cov_75.171807_4_plen_105_part_00
MSHLHTLQIRPQIYTDLLQGDTHWPYYLYVGASEDSVRRFTQHQQAYDAYHSAAASLMLLAVYMYCTTRSSRLYGCTCTYCFEFRMASRRLSVLIELSFKSRRG